MTIDLYYKTEFTKAQLKELKKDYQDIPELKKDLIAICKALKICQ